MNFEVINYTENLPFKIYITNPENSEYHWHKEIELIFLLKGSLTYEVKKQKYKLSEHDIFLVNSFDIHSMLSEGYENIILVLQIDPSFFDKYYPSFSGLYFEFNDFLNDVNNEVYYKLRSNLAEIMLTLVKQNANYRLKAVTLATDLVLMLLKSLNCKTRNDNLQLSMNERTFELLTFIDKNYNTDLSLNSLSKEVLMSPQYISKLFKTVLGINFVDYIHKLRIKKSLNDLLGSNKSILDISLEHGFNDHKSYSRVFKKDFGINPTEYRKNFAKTMQPQAKTEYNSERPNYDSNNYFKYLYDFIGEDKKRINDSSNIYSKTNININFTITPKTKMKKYWKRITSIGRAALCLRHEVRNQIKTVQKDIGYDFIRFHGIFSDEMRVYSEDSKGNPIYNWNYIDEIFDFFYEINLKPFVEIGFMPVSLASKKQYAAFFWQANVSYPKSISKWCNLVSAFIKHCIERYSIEEVEKWYFDIWNAPELENAFWFDGRGKFFKFYKETYFSIKDISNTLKVGTPSVLSNTDLSWFNEFLVYCKDNSIILDFISCHLYATTDPKNEEMPKEILNFSNTKYSVSDENFLKKTTASIKKIIANNGLSNLELLITEWNLSPYTRDYTRDTCFLSTYIVFNVVKNIGNIDGLTFWNLSDIVEEGTTDNRLFHGGLGMFTFNGLKKPSYNAFFLLSKLGDNIVEIGEDYIVTSKGNNLQILIYNFTYFDELFRTGDKSLLSYHERYNIFKAINKKESSIMLSLNKGTYRIKRSSLNQNSGSIFDAWLKMGAPEEILPDVYNFLKSKESPDINITKEAVKKTLVLNDIVPVHGILLIEIDKLD